MSNSKNLSDIVKNDTFCSMAWTHQFMDPTGRIKPCCRFEEIHRPLENHFDFQSLKDVFEGEWMDDVRRKMLNGQKVDGCSRCYQEQDAGKKSLRQRYNENTELPIDQMLDLDSPNIKWIELAISNNCNLACRMCDSRYSMKWFDEEKESFGFTRNTKKVSKMEIENIFPFIPHLQHIKFTGGEPLITPDHWILIEKLIQERDCRDIFLNYSTNCTVAPQPKWIEAWNQFKFVEFAMSFDSCAKEETEYIRWPAKYEKIEETTKAFLRLGEKENYKIILRSTISILNVWSLPETLEWWMNNSPANKPLIMNPTHLTHPMILSLTTLPKKIKNRISEKFKKSGLSTAHKSVKKNLDYIESYMHSQDTSFLLESLRDYIQKTDLYRDQNFFLNYPQYFDIFDSLKAEMPGVQDEL